MVTLRACARFETRSIDGRTSSRFVSFHIRGDNFRLQCFRAEFRGRVRSPGDAWMDGWMDGCVGHIRGAKIRHCRPRASIQPSIANECERGSSMGRARGFGFTGKSSSSSSSSSSSRKRSSAPAYTYQVNFSGGRKYIGMAHTKSSLKTRIATQLSGGPGASAVCKNNRARSVSGVFKHKSAAAAKAAETKRYHSTKAALGADKVRGAGHTKDFKK